MKKNLLIIASMLVHIFLYAASLDHNAILGFNGVYKENSWTPVIIRISNNGQAMSGNLVIETENSSTAIEQKRRYTKPVDLPENSYKEFFYVIPIGHHNKDLKYYFETNESIVFEKIIPLKQRGLRRNFILGISPYPDLGFLNDHKEIGNRSISYPHIDNLPHNSSAYDSVDIISIHREMMDKLSFLQFRAISGWVSRGGILVVWGGKSPSPSKWNYLPSEITGLKQIEPDQILSEIEDVKVPADSILLNLLRTPEKNRLVRSGGLDLISVRPSGKGSIFFISFDYSEALRNWPGLNRIWDIFFSAIQKDDQFPIKMKEDFLLENYIAMFDNSGFTYLERTNVALILFLSASASISILIFIYFRRKSKYLKIFTMSLMFFLLLLPFLIFINLFNKKFRNDSYVLSSDIIYQTNNSDESIHYKDIFIGSSHKTRSDIILGDDSLSILKQDKIEDLSIEMRPEIVLQNIEMDRWSSQIYRLERIIDSLITIKQMPGEFIPSVEIINKSDHYIHDTFLLYKGKKYLGENIMPGDRFIGHISEESDFYSNNPLLETTARLYLDLMDLENTVLFCGFISDEISPLEFSNKGWKKKSVQMLISTLHSGDFNE
ncbi:MAG: hypothetical protein JEY91_05825 [Spirochaetaceae bacterium]|nr:hypothetical protein [Spirochaetaceae bacterium]